MSLLPGSLQTWAIMFFRVIINLKLLQPAGARRISFGQPSAKPGFPWCAADRGALLRRGPEAEGTGTEVESPAATRGQHAKWPRGGSASGMDAEGAAGLRFTPGKLGSEWLQYHLPKTMQRWRPSRAEPGLTAVRGLQGEFRVAPGRWSADPRP